MRFTELQKRDQRVCFARRAAGDRDSMPRAAERQPQWLRDDLQSGIGAAASAGEVRGQRVQGHAECDQQQ